MTIGDHRERHDRGVRVTLEPGAELQAFIARAIGVDDHQRRQPAQDALFDGRRLRQGNHGQPFSVDPAGHEVRYGTSSRREEENGLARPHLAPRVRVEGA